MRRRNTVLILALAIGLPAWLAHRLLAPAVLPERQVVATPTSPTDRLPALTPVAATVTAPVAADWQRDVYPTAVDPAALDAQAVASLHQARVYGDPRTPPILRDTKQSEAAPSAAELADPARYADYEGRQQRKLIAGFMRAAGPEIGRLQQQMVVAEQAGLSQAQLAEGREKLARLSAMQAELAGRYPDLARDAGPPPPDTP